MTRALVIEASGNLWGSERALLDLIENLPSVEVAVCCPPGRPLIDKLAKLGVTTLPYFSYALHNGPRWRRLAAAIGVLRACVEFHPSVIYLNQSGSYKVASVAATLLDLPIVAHIRIFEDAGYLARQTPHPHLLRGMIAISAAVEAEIRRFRELDAIPRHRIYDAYALCIQSSSSERIANRIACVGRLVPVKGQDLLVRAMGAFGAASAECLIVGDGEEHFIRKLKEIASNGNSVASIQWLGFAQDVVPLLRTCSVLACPSHFEPLGRVIFEAWDAGAVPVVFSGSGGAAEIVTAAEGGLLYQMQEPESLAETLRDALDLTPAERTRLVTNGRSWMAKNCNPTTYGDEISAIFKAACG
jgi:glycosyltransferase involved in cell wall biosynthesis